MAFLLIHQSYGQSGRQTEAKGIINASEYESIQSALDLNPVKMVFIPDGEYRSQKALRITHDSG